MKSCDQEFIVMLTLPLIFSSADNLKKKSFTKVLALVTVLFIEAKRKASFSISNFTGSLAYK